MQHGVQPVVLAAGDEYLSALYPVQDVFLPPGIQLAEHVVQQHHRILAHGVFMDLPLRQLQAQRRRAYLPLRAVLPGAASIDENLHIVLVGAGQTQPAGSAARCAS